MKMYESFIQQLKEQQLGHRLVYSEEEARNSEIGYLVVLIPKPATGWFDVSLTTKSKGAFVRFASWKAEDLQKEPVMLDVIFRYIQDRDATEVILERVRKNREDV